MEKGQRVQVMRGYNKGQTGTVYADMGSVVIVSLDEGNPVHGTSARVSPKSLRKI